MRRKRRRSPVVHPARAVRHGGVGLLARAGHHAPAILPAGVVLHMPQALASRQAVARKPPFASRQDVAAKLRRLFTAAVSPGLPPARNPSFRITSSADVTDLHFQGVPRPVRLICCADLLSEARVLFHLAIQGGRSVRRQSLPDDPPRGRRGLPAGAFSPYMRQ